MAYFYHLWRKLTLTNTAKTVFKSSSDETLLPLKDSLINLEILSSKANESKNDKYLNQITDSSIKNEISKSSNIPITEFEKYSDITNIDDLKELRKKVFLDIFNKNRSTTLN